MNNNKSTGPVLLSLTENGQKWLKDMTVRDIDWYMTKLASEGRIIESVEVASTSTRCADCGHGYRDHFENKGLCNLGFCRSHCGEFVFTA